MQLAMSPGWNCQYVQINLGNASRHDEIFTPPTEWQGVQRDWKRFDYVFDFSGETGFDKAELVRCAFGQQWGAVGRALGPGDQVARGSGGRCPVAGGRWIRWTDALRCQFGLGWAAPA